MSNKVLKDLPKLPFGEGSMTYMKNGKVRYRKTIQLDGFVQKIVSVTKDTPKECMVAMRERELEIKNGYVSKTNKLLYDEMIAWLEIDKRPCLKIQSYRTLRNTINNQIKNSEIGNLRYQHIKADEIRQFINKLNFDMHYSYSTIKKTFDALNEFFRVKSIEEGFKNPMVNLKKPKRSNVIHQTKEIEFFAEEDIRRFVDVSISTWKNGTPRYRFGAAISANLFLGMRVGELMALCWEDVDFETRVVRVNKTIIADDIDYDNNGNNYKIMYKIQKETKTSKSRYVPMNEDAFNLLEMQFKRSEFKDDNDFVLSTRNRKSTTIMDISDTIKAIEERADTKTRYSGSHIMRHTCASLLFRKNVPIEIIASILGNSREVCESTYIHFVEEQRINATSSISMYLASII